jgi:hypothetical protein
MAAAATGIDFAELTWRILETSCSEVQGIARSAEVSHGA